MIDYGHRRVLITGSRRWPIMAAYMIHAVLEAERRQVPPGAVLTVVHGRCRKGADLFAHQWVNGRTGTFDTHRPLPAQSVREEPHEAKWDRQCDSECRHATAWRDDEPYCPRAGFIRNEEMAALGADICHAFIAGKSDGTHDCAQRAEAHGIIVIRHSLDPNDYE